MQVHTKCQTETLRAVLCAGFKGTTRAASFFFVSSKPGWWACMPPCSCMSLTSELLCMLFAFILWSLKFVCSSLLWRRTSSSANSFIKFAFIVIVFASSKFNARATFSVLGKSFASLPHFWRIYIWSIKFEDALTTLVHIYELNR